MKTKDFINYLREFANYIEHMEGIKESPGHLKLDEFIDKYEDELSTRVANGIKSNIHKDSRIPTVYQFLRHSGSVYNFGKKSKEELRAFIENA